MNCQKLKKEFDNLNEIKQWAFAKKYKTNIVINLNNDNTTFTFNKKNKTNDYILSLFETDTIVK